MEIKYDGYIKRQLADEKRFRRMEDQLLPEDGTTSPCPGCASRRGRSSTARGRSRSGRRRAHSRRVARRHQRAHDRSGTEAEESGCAMN